MRKDNSLAFPNAAIKVPAQEQKYWMDDGEMSKMSGNQRMEGLFKNNRRIFGNAEIAKRVQPYEAGKEIVPGITAVATNGHSLGHTSQVVSSGGKSLFVQGDVTHVPYLFARNPGWHLMFDQDPQAAEATRRKVYDMLAAERMMVQGFHYPFPGVGLYREDADRLSRTYGAVEFDALTERLQRPPETGGLFSGRSRSEEMAMTYLVTPPRARWRSRYRCFGRSAVIFG